MSQIERIKDGATLALAASAGAVASLLPQQATAQGQNAAGDDGLEEVVVTGSRIRRVDAETASPVLVIDNEAILQSGVKSLGDLVQRIPSIAGAAFNPQVNNGGGFAESNVELRGLDVDRTLVLLNGRRLTVVGSPAASSGAVDVNQIPVAILERVEVLKEGAGAIYGSDAVAGVVNFITRKDLEAPEVSIDYGQTSEGDGEHYSASASWGMQSDSGNFLISGAYTKFEAVSAGDRDFARFALYLYSGSVQQGGSSRTPTGRVFLPAGNPFGCSSVTRIAGRSGATTADYRCFAAPGDLYNYQPFNLAITPSERGSLYLNGDYNINDSVQIYAEVLYNRTSSGYQIAPLPFDALADDVVISAASVYNPFGIDFGGFNTPRPGFRVRLESLGNRFSSTATDSKIINTGLRGGFGSSDWDWDANIGYSRLDQTQAINGYLYQPDLRTALGPSFISAGGVPTCGTPAAPISGCVPINIFNVQTPTAIAALQRVTTSYATDHAYVAKGVALNASGPIFSMPAGEAQLAIGAEYREPEFRFDVDRLVEAAPPLFTNCIIASEACTGDARGDYDVKELYAELFVPLLKDLPAVDTLNLTVGTRVSDYSLFGDSTNSQFKLEYRPIADVLLRGTYSQVFRVPTLGNLFAAPAITNPTFADPCLGLTQARVTANPNLAIACQFVIRNGTYAGDGTSQITGVITSNPDLTPEEGDVTTVGIVAEPSLLRGFSVSLDYWKYEVENLITELDPNYSIQQCAQNANPAFCSLVTRYATGPNAGRIAAFQMPNRNLGSLETSGFDLGIGYTLRDTAAGTFRFSIDASRIDEYVITAAPGAAPEDIAGLFDRQFGNYAEWRGTLSVGWAFRGFDALASARYIDNVALLNADGAAPFSSPTLFIPDVTYVNLALGYNIESWKTKVQLVVDNLTDKDPPLFYQNNVINSNTDVSTYDTIGRRFSVSLTKKF